MRVERIVLEHHRQVALTRSLLVDPLAPDQHVAGRDVLEADDHPQQCRFPATRRPDEDHELTIGDVEADVVDGLETVSVLLDDVLMVISATEDSFQPFTAPDVRPETIRRWNTRTMMMIGIVTTTAAADKVDTGGLN